MNSSSERFCQQMPIKEARYIYRVEHRVMEGDCQYDHGPREVEVKAFLMDKYPVTNVRFKAFLDETGYRPEDGSNFLKHWQGGKIPPGQEHFPVVWVSLKDAKAYAAWIGGRLPTDAEWQYAAGGPEKRKWPWGDAFNRGLCNADGDDLTPVDFYPGRASPFGIADLCGNAWEWTHGVVDEGMHLFAFLRGGSYYKAPHMWHAEGGPHPNNFHLKFPLLNEGMNRCGNVGFRCVKDGE